MYSLYIRCQMAVILRPNVCYDRVTRGSSSLDFWMLGPGGLSSSINSYCCFASTPTDPFFVAVISVHHYRFYFCLWSHHSWFVFSDVVSFEP